MTLPPPPPPPMNPCIVLVHKKSTSIQGYLCPSARTIQNVVTALKGATSLPPHWCDMMRCDMKFVPFVIPTHCQCIAWLDFDNRHITSIAHIDSTTIAPTKTTCISLKSHVALAMRSHQQYNTKNLQYHLLVNTLEDAGWYIILIVLTNVFVGILEKLGWWLTHGRNNVYYRFYSFSKELGL